MADANDDHLTAVDENCVLPLEQQCCSWLRRGLEEISAMADGTILEIEGAASPTLSSPTLSLHLYLCQAVRRRHRRAGAGQADSQEQSRHLDLGDDPAAQVRVLPTAVPRPGRARSHELHLACRRHHHRRLEENQAALQPIYQRLSNAIAKPSIGTATKHAAFFVKRDDKAGFVWHCGSFAAKDSIARSIRPAPTTCSRRTSAMTPKALSTSIVLSRV